MTLTIGRVALSSDEIVESLSQSELQLQLQGRQKTTNLADGTFRRQLRGMLGQVVPLTWQESPGENGWWVVTAAQADQETPSVASWTLGLSRVGHHSSLQWQSRRSGGALPNDHALSAELWHAPPAGAQGYETGATEPARIARQADGVTVDVYRNVPATNPQWAITPAAFYDGAVEVTANGVPVVGIEHDQDLAGIWQMSNGLIRVSERTGGLTVEHYSSAAWHSKDYDIQQDAVNVVWEAATVLRNTPQVCVVRLQSKPGSGIGRTLVDIEMKRGARHISCYMQRHATATLKVQRATAEQGTQIVGGIRATADDVNGDRYVLASTKTHNLGTAQGSISKTLVPAFDFAIGVEVDGTIAQAGDTAADVVAQYLDGSDTVDVAVQR